jgi:hypothetical protein
MDLEPRVDALDQPDEAEVLDDDGTDAAVDGVAKQEQCVPEFRGLEQDVQREIHAYVSRPSHRTRLIELVERELRPLIARIEAFDAHVHGIRPVRDGGANGVKRTGWGEKFEQRFWVSGFGLLTLTA